MGKAPHAVPLEETPEIFRIITENVDDLIAVLDPRGKRLYNSPSYASIFGDAARLTGTDSFLEIHPDDRERVRTLFLQTVATGVGNRIEYRFQLPDGAVRFIESRGTLVRGADGAARYVVVVARDVTERREAESRLRLLAHALSSTRDGFSLTDLDGRILFVNTAFARMFDHDESALVGLPINTIYAESNPQRLLDEIIPASVAGGWNGEIAGRRSDASEFPLELWTSPVPDEQGAPVAIAGFVRDITDRRRTMELLRKGEQRFRALIENSSDGIAMLAADGTSIYFSPSTRKILGYADPELLGKSIFGLVPTEDRISAERQFGEILRSPAKQVAGLYKVRHRDGSMRWIESVGTNLLDEPGIGAVVVNFRDVTERKRNEQLQEAVYRIALAADHAPNLDALFRELHGIIATVMPAGNFYIALYDEKSDMLSFPYFVDEVDVPSPPQRLGRGLTEYVLRTGRSLLVDKEVDERLQRTGEVELVGVSSPIWLGVPLIIDNATIGVMTVQHYSDPHAYGQRELQVLELVSSQVARAIERKRSEDALRESEVRYRNLFEQNPTGIYRTTPEGNVVMANPALLRMLGYSTMDELRAIDINVDGVESGYERSRFRELVDRDGEVRGLESAWLKKDRTVIFVRENARAIRDTEGRVLYYEGTVEDITERKRLEQQLMQAQKMEGIGTLAGGIAHDFNNLLGIILGYTQLLEGGKVTPERYAKSLDTIKKAVERGAELVRQLLTFARKADPSFRPIDVNEVVTELARMVGETFSKAITVRVELDRKAPKIFADRTQLHQALLNLCVNARDAILDPRRPSDAGGTLTLRTGTMPGYMLQQRYSKATSNEYVFVSVEDTGVGMDEATQKRVFEPFFTTKELGKGTGLGLAVVYGVVNSHHGFTEFRSEYGVGTTFTSYFPATLSEEPVVELTEPKPVAEAQFTEKVLLVEDEEMLLDLLAGLLGSQGYEVLTAKDGQEGLEIYTANADSIAVVLSDMGLPKLGGWEMFQKMKEVNPRVKAILASGYFDPNVKMDLLKAGAKDFIQKPYIPDQILKRIREVIDEPPAAA